MPLILHKNITNDCILGIWEMSENADELIQKLRITVNELAIYKKLSNQKKKLEWACSRMLLEQLTKRKDYQIIHNEYRKPLIKNSSLNISVSHSYHYLTIIISPYETGIDIELIQPKIKRVAEKFMNRDELSSIGLDNHLEKLYIYWCSKESLYKLYGKKKLLFKENISIAPFQYSQEGIVSGRIRIGFFDKSFQLKYEKINQFMLVYILNS